MRKQVWFSALAAGVLLFSACKSEDIPAQGGNESASDQKLVLNLATGGNQASRAGRPLLSSAAGQDIDKLTLFFIDGESKIALKKEISSAEWHNGATAYNKGMQIEISLKASNGEALDASPAGTKYTVYAVGYSEGTTYNNGFLNGALTKDAAFTQAGNFWAQTEENTGEEIFAGEAKITAIQNSSGETCLIQTSESGATYPELPAMAVPSIVLNRQVAGVTGYFTNIRTGKMTVGTGLTAEPVKLRLVASGRNNRVKFENLVSGETTTSTTVNYVINGAQNSELGNAKGDARFLNSSTDDAYVVYEVNLADWFKYGGDTGRSTFADCDINGDGVVGFEDAIAYVYGKDNVAKLQGNDLKNTWSKAIEGNKVFIGTEPSEVQCNALSDFWAIPTSNKGQQLVAGSVFAGEFLIPFAQTTGKNTFELQLLDKDGQILDHWNVRIPEGEKYTKPEGGGVSTGVIATAESDISTSIYNVFRNHVYSLGLKAQDTDNGGPVDPTDPTTPEPDPKPEPDDDKDEPSDLSVGQNLLINVNDQWEIIHQMEID
ncbi:hypothetical protein [Phocaeicola coprophilus]|uniref:hypothetical protein n=1 Tax=Phocaeicola coprophilus TaxID=387090 RepID=UPI00294373CC|nr:hypothetical protein [Phocaeicola coprophilus]